ncbi:hypothetical protein [Demetria terragena]|uniref:hypothetical protein n=1 Tax=Demetria terragena TaxID=63959 RepID=UPI0003677753|nr:hypothetical protein [Demetria terragena]
MVRRWVYVVVGSVLAFAALSMAVSQITPEQTRHAMPQSGPTVVVGVPGLEWSDISKSSQPGLWALLQASGTASMTPRATSSPTCTADGWLSLGAGRAADAHCKLPGTLTSGKNVTVPGWSKLQDQKGDATPGLLASTLRKNKQCTTAVGVGAALAAADEQGKVARYFAAPSAEAMQACPVTFVDVGTSTGAAPKNLEKALQPIFSNIKTAPTVIIAGISDGKDSTTKPRALFAVGATIKRGTLTSESTRQPGFVSAPDISAHVLDRVKNPPAELVGSVFTVRPTDGPDAAVAQERRRTDIMLIRSQAASMPFQIGAGILTALALGIGVWRWKKSGSAPAWLAPVSVTLACFPAASWLVGLVPWWRGGPTTLFFLAAFVVAVSLIMSVAYAGPWREWSAGPPLIVAAITLAVLGIDVINGSRLQFIAPQGLQPLEGGRFFGMGNAGFGFFATAALLLGGFIAARLVWWDDADDTDVRLAGASVAVVGFAAAVIDAWPTWGADFGGPPALLVGTGVAVVLILGLKLSVKRVLLIAAGALVVVAIAALVDWRRDPGSRTHLGRFVQQIIDGDAFGVILGKLGANLALLFSSPVAPLVPILMVIGWLVVLQPAGRFGRPVAWLWEEMPVLRWVCLGLLTCWSIAFLLNDSGVGVPATGAQFAIPLLVAIAVVARRERDAPV